MRAVRAGRVAARMAGLGSWRQRPGEVADHRLRVVPAAQDDLGPGPDVGLVHEEGHPGVTRRGDGEVRRLGDAEPLPDEARRVVVPPVGRLVFAVVQRRGRGRGERRGR